MDALAEPAVKQRLIDETETAIGKGVFGSPFVIADGEPFLGGRPVRDPRRVARH